MEAGEKCKSCPGVAGREAHVEHHRGVAGDVVDVARRGVDEENLSIRPHTVTWNREKSDARVVLVLVPRLTFMYVTVDVIFGFDPPLY